MAGVAVQLGEDVTVFSGYILDSSIDYKICCMFFAGMYWLWSPLGFVKPFPTYSTMFLQLFLVILHETSHF